jgi:hypothetical protein
LQNLDYAQNPAVANQSDRYNEIVPFNRNQIEARLALNIIGSADMPQIAWDAMEAGLDGPATRRLAALVRPTYFEVADIMPRVMQELKLSHIAVGEAALRVAKDLAREILGNDDPLQHLRTFEALWFRSEYAKEIQPLGTLDDETSVGRMMGKSEQQLRELVISVLKDFAR